MPNRMDHGTTIIVAGRLNAATRKYEIAWIDDNDAAHVIGSYDTMQEAELASLEYVIGKLEEEVLMLKARTEVLRIEVETFRAHSRAPKAFMPPPRQSS